MAWGILLSVGALTMLLNGCVSKSQANARAQAAFLAGQQQGMARAQQIQSSGGNITIMGAVRNNQVPWTTGLTLANALITADYTGQSEPKEIIINRGGQQLRIDPKMLLNGQDVPLESRDVIEIR